VQVLVSYFKDIINAFVAIIYLFRLSIKSLFIENSNLAYGYKFTYNCYI
jgi:hypothetical protein